jgi:hypothetical protein
MEQKVGGMRSRPAAMTARLARMITVWFSPSGK